MPRGPKPLPTAIKAMRGTLRSDRRRNDEPQPEAVALDPPDDLQGEAADEWRRIVPELHACGLLSRLDYAALLGYCQALGRWREAEREIQRQGLLVKSPNGFPVQNPYLSVANRAMKQVKEFASEFGLTPSSRTRIAISPPDDEALAEFVKWQQMANQRDARHERARLELLELQDDGPDDDLDDCADDLTPPEEIVTTTTTTETGP
jgi:P27 family predicted phage terminase small subunit